MREVENRGCPPTLKLRWMKESRDENKDSPLQKLWCSVKKKELRPTYAKASVDERE